MRPNLNILAPLVALALAILLGCAIMANATNYYVSDSLGSNSFDGSSPTWTGGTVGPKYTVTAGYALCDDGDTLYIREGTYYEQLYLNDPGSAVGGWITLEGYPGDERPIIDGSNPVSTWTVCAADDPCLVAAGVNQPYADRIYWAWVNDANLPATLSDTMFFEDGNLVGICSEPNQVLPYSDSVAEMTLLTGPPDANLARNYIEDANRTEIDDFWIGAWLHIYIHKQNATVVEAVCSDWEQTGATFTFTPMQDVNREIQTEAKRDAYRIVNHPHCITEPGEYYIGPEENVSGTLKRKFFYWPIDPAFATKMRVASKNYGAYRQNIGSPFYLKLKGIDFQGQAAYGLNFTGIASAYASYLTIEDCNVQNIGSNGMILQFISDVNVINCDVINVGGRGILLDGGSDNIFTECYFAETGSSNLGVQDQNDCVIYRNRFYGSAGGHGNGLTLYGSYDVYAADSIDFDFNQRIMVAQNYFNHSNCTLNYCEDIYFYGNLFDMDQTKDIMYAIEPHGSTYNGDFLLFNNLLNGTDRQPTGSMGDGWSVRSRVFDPNTDRCDNYMYNNIFDGVTQDWDYTLWSWASPPDGAWWKESNYDGTYGTNKVNGEYTYATITRSHNSHLRYVFSQSPAEEWSLGAGSYDHTDGTPPNGRRTDWSDLATLFVDGSYEGDWRPLTGGELDGTGTSIATIVSTFNLDTMFPEVDFTVDINDTAWNNPPSIGPYAGSGAAVAPTITSNGGSPTWAFNHEEGTTAAATITASGSGPIAFSISGGADAADFSIDSSSGALAFASTPVFASPDDADLGNDYEVTVAATNAQGLDVQYLTITVYESGEPEPDPPAGSARFLIAMEISQ